MHDDASSPLCAVYDGVATITLNRPRHRNCLHDEDLRALVRHVESANRDAFAQAVEVLAAARPLTLAALAGSVYGGAVDLALACDFRIGVSGMQARVPAEALLAEVQRRCTVLAALAPLAVQGMKRTLRELAEGGGEPQAWRVRELATHASADFAAGIAAARARRAPVFGRVEVRGGGMQDE